MIKDRKSRVFFLAGIGREVIGYETQEPDIWWVPSEGSSLSVGHHLFDSRLAALRKGKANCEKTIADAQKQLEIIERQIREELRV